MRATWQAPQLGAAHAYNHLRDLHCTCYGTHATSANCYTAPIRAGLETYKVSGATAAVTRWLKDSPVTEPSGGTARAFEQIELAYGRMVGYDIVDIVPFGKYASRSYLVLLYEKGPVYAWFDCYMPKTEWIITGFLFNTKPDAILPPKMFTH